MKKTYHGSCHCGAVQFGCELDLSHPTSRCNCSMCGKGRFWKAIAPARDFELLAGEEALSRYDFGSRSIHHFFCRHCGIKPFGTGHMDALGGDFYAINLATLDDASDMELAAAPVHYEDGRHDRWDRAPAETRAL